MTYRDNIFATYHVKLDIPAAPVVTLNYLTNMTNETFSSSYEYSYEGSVWYDCSDSAISFEPGAVTRWLWVRMKGTATSAAGNIAKIAISAQPRIAGDITVTYDGACYRIKGLAAGAYNYAFTNNKACDDFQSFTVAEGETITIRESAKWTYLAIKTPASETSFESLVRFVAVEEGETVPYTYSIEDGEVTINEYLGAETEIEIPAEIEGYPVTKILSGAFASNDTLQCVIIPESVTSIGEDAFAGCENLVLSVSPNSYAHTWCEESGQQYVLIHEHSWNKGVYIVEQTCTEAGEKLFTCQICGETKTEAVPPHYWCNGTVTDWPADEPGEMQYECLYCDTTKLEPVIYGIPGDANEDKQVDMLDIISLMEWYCGGTIELNVANGEVTGEGSIDMLDIITLMEWFCGADVPLYDYTEEVAQ